MICLIIYLSLLAMSLGISLAKHGEERRISFWQSLVALIIQLALLYGAGLFDKYL